MGVGLRLLRVVPRQHVGIIGRPAMRRAAVHTVEGRVLGPPIVQATLQTAGCVRRPSNLARLPVCSLAIMGPSDTVGIEQKWG